MTDVADKLRSLAELRDSGVLTDDEFDAEKQKVLAGSATTAPAIAPVSRTSQLTTNHYIVACVMVVVLAIGAYAGIAYSQEWFPFASDGYISEGALEKDLKLQVGVKDSSSNASGLIVADSIDCVEAESDGSEWKCQVTYDDDTKADYDVTVDEDGEYAAEPS